MRPIKIALAGLMMMVCLGLVQIALADGPTVHILKWKHYDGTNAANAELKLDHTKLGKGQPAIDALYKLIAAMPVGDVINLKQGVMVRPGVRQFPLNLGDLMKTARAHGVTINVPANDAPS